ncbi:MAG: D-2-hydroxyacid dehydrogenase [Schleiferiaceae bacterium]|jgi:D-3-phosphoglycerate dehydrogenase|nr:D-2-hydroxyacid dehydrogenase [Schleiferiaceae bacterium]
MKVLANDGISVSGAQALEKLGHELLDVKVAQDQLIEYINKNGVEALLVRSATKVRTDIIDACESLKVIGRGGVGMDNIDVDYARDKGLHVINTPAASSQSVAELCMAHLYGMVRFLHDANRQMPLDGDSRFKELKKNYGGGIELQGRTLGIIGFGRIGQALAKLAVGVGMKVVMTDLIAGNQVITKVFYDGQTAEFEIKNLSMEELLKSSDFVSIHIPGGNLISKEQIEMMKDGAGIINASRGGVINEPDLIQALESGKLRYAALDVFENEPSPAIKVLMSPYISLSPHIGAATLEAQDRIGVELAEKIDAIAKGEV